MRPVKSAVTNKGRTANRSWGSNSFVLIDAGASIERFTVRQNRLLLKGVNIRFKGHVYANVYTPLDRGMVLLQFAAGSFYTKKLCSRVHSIELEFYSQKPEIRFLSHPLGELRYIRTSSIARSKARVAIIAHFSVALTVLTL